MIIVAILERHLNNLHAGYEALLSFSCFLLLSFNLARSSFSHAAPPSMCSDRFSIPARPLSVVPYAAGV